MIALVIAFCAVNLALHVNSLFIIWRLYQRVRRVEQRPQFPQDITFRVIDGSDLMRQIEIDLGPDDSQLSENDDDEDATRH